MRYAISLCCLIAVVLSGCDLSPFGSNVETDKLNEAKVRWATFGFNRYSLKQTRSCECLPPYSYRVIVEANEVDSLVYGELGEAWEGRSNELYRSAVGNAWTVEEAFEAVEQARDEAAEVRVEYNERYGYPTQIYIDYHADYIDDEITWTMSDFQPSE